ncbi:MAG: FtsX-like permease family protein [Solirubrobacterales bacterium]
MTRLALRGIAARKLRTALSAIAIVLGVAMVVGTYVLTDQIRTAFDDISSESVEGIDVVVTPDEAFTAQFASEAPTLDASLVDAVGAVDGVGAVEGQVGALGRILVEGEVVDTFGAPGLVIGSASEAFDPTENVAGRDPTGPGEASLLEQNAEDHGIDVGDRIGVATRHGVETVTVVGVFAYGEGGSALGGTTAVELPPRQVQRWFDLRGRVSSINVIAEPGVEPAELSERVAAALPSSARSQTADENAEETANEINDQIGAFLTPALLALAGAAVLVGAFIIFNTFSITVAQRAREFAMLRAIGATRAQVLAAVVGEALAIGFAASAVGIAAGVGLAKLFSSLFDAVGFGIPRSDVVLAPRTLVIAVIVGVGVTLLAALVPAIRATRVAPVAALSTAPRRASRRSRRVAAAISALMLAGGVALAAHGLFGSGPATARLAAMAGGAVAIFVGIALTARYIVRPLATAVGYPIELAFHTPGRLARENAVRNPGRTALTSAALMVGLGLVVFVAVFAAGLKSSFARQIDELVKAEIFVYGGQGLTPIPERVQGVVEDVPGVAAAVANLFDQVEVDGEPSNIAYDVLIGTDTQELDRVYTFDWIEGDDSLVEALGPGDVLIEEQFSLAHDLGVGDTYGVQAPTGGRGTLEVVGVYRDPTILQGSIATIDTLRTISPARDPIALMLAVDTGADAAAVETALNRALRPFPAVEVESKAEYEQTIEGQLDQIVYLLYALLAMSVVISLFGIANSLFLSIHERTRELGVLRAIGTTRGQIRRVIRYESVITSVIGGLLGTLVGIAFAGLVIASLSEFGLRLSIPLGQLAAFLALAVLVGVIGAIAPARRAARVDVLAALHQE